MNYFKVLCAVMIVVIVGWSVKASAGIAGSAHDFQDATGWNAAGDQICQPCHTPHNAGTTKPLWNHAESAVASYTVYTNTNSLNATVGQPSGSTKLCLSCHDGTVALDNFGGGNPTATTMISGIYNLGSNLSNDHPVSFTYDAALATADGGLKNPATENSGLGGTIAADMLKGGNLECSSCHDVHNSASIAKLLVKSNTGSGLCITCHTK
jgi:predicted CXXCH cytochrome family protein